MTWDDLDVPQLTFTEHKLRSLRYDPCLRSDMDTIL